MNECCICESNADYITVEGGWYVCKECIETGKTDKTIKKLIHGLATKRYAAADGLSFTQLEV